MFESLLFIFLYKKALARNTLVYLRIVKILIENPILYLLTRFLYFLYYTMAISILQVSREHFLPSSLLDGFQEKFPGIFGDSATGNCQLGSFSRPGSRVCQGPSDAGLRRVVRCLGTGAAVAGGECPVGNPWEIGRQPLAAQASNPEEGSEPGALRGHDAVCHGHGHWGG
ncbi:hypothetical protein, partial [Evtepia sp.]